MSANDNNQYEHGQDLNISAIVTVGVTFAILSIVVVMYLYGLYLRTAHAEHDRKGDSITAEFEQMKLEQLQKINNTYGWVDPESGIAMIPISDAIEDTVQWYQNSSGGPQFPVDIVDNPPQEGMPEAGAETETGAEDTDSETAGRPGE